MDMKAAAQETMELARRHGMDNISSDNPELDYPHLMEMLEKMLTTDMSPAKLGRWLGWMQASVVSLCDEISLEDMKKLNMKYAD